MNEQLTMGHSPKLSILICHLESRGAVLQELMGVLRPQMSPAAEIWIGTDDGKMSVGEKRNTLLGCALGEYVVFVDDDDLVCNNYISLIVNAIRTQPDCCSLMGKIFFQKRSISKTFIHSIEYSKWFELNGVYYRCPNHLNAIRREIALKVGFPMKDVGEDHEFSTAIRPLLQTEVKIPDTLYYYRTT